MRDLFVCAAVLSVAVVACNLPSARLNAPPHGVPEVTSDLQGSFVYMTDNALLEDMCISDVHFLPHRATLSTLGQQRLSRLASLLDAYGGAVRFSTKLADEDLIDARTETIVEFLCEAGIDTTTEVVSRGLPGGRGMDAREAVLIKIYEATYQPAESQTDESAPKLKLSGD